ncbi:MAG: hypothetical protein QM638_14285 [Nocardioides sp.]|uniref:hypothetical protein n=1 Tax=Nocardioides sp. TaxID=35761 RepID=UPI0039E3DDF8
MPPESDTISAELALLRECQDRVLEREGIPMVLALVDERGTAPAAPAVTDADVLTDGAALADAMTGYRDALVPSSRDDDMGCLITVLQTTSYADFGREGVQL